MKNKQIIDTHTHAFPDFLAEKAIMNLNSNMQSYSPSTDGTVKGLLLSMDQSNIETSWIANIATKEEHAESILNWSKEIHTKRMIPLGSILPFSHHIEKRIINFKKSGLPGIKMHPMYQNFVIDDPKMYPAYEIISSHNLFLLLHAGYDDAFPKDDRAAPFRIAKIHHDFPQLKIIAAHTGGWHYWQNVIDEIISKDIYFDTSFIQEIEPQLLKQIINKHNKDYILFGTDCPWQNQKLSVEYIEKILLKDNEKEKIFYQNAINLLHSVGYEMK